ncbi:MAG: SRPBCC family protein [Gaiellaceae bacterium]
MVSNAGQELLAPLEDVWGFVSEPHHFGDWWPGVAAVEPDRRGFAEGARWQLRGAEPTLFRRTHGVSTLVVHRAEPYVFAFHVVQDRLDAELTLEPGGSETLARLAVSFPFWRPQRALPSVALGRLYDLCQTAAAL